jgi:hypothetical protein
MGGPNAAAVVAVEILVEQDQIPPVGIVLEQLDITVEGAATIVATPEQVDQAVLQLQGDFPQIQPACPSRWGTPP